MLLLGRLTCLKPTPFVVMLCSFVMLSAYSYELCSSSSSNNTIACLPCPLNCSQCSSSAQCLSCSIQYYSSTIGGTLYCLSCVDNCLTCNNSLTCNTCQNGYVLNNQTCTLCQINNSLTCSSVISATACQNYYYLSDSYCLSCMLNCQLCTSPSSCQTCSSGYFLNSTIITCNPCPSGCSSCDQYTPSNCLSCQNGYTYSSSNASCSVISCPILNCLYCSQNSSRCGQCVALFYWDGSSCMSGSSMLCENGAIGILPTQCINQCNSITSYLKNISSSLATFSCLPYHSSYTNYITTSQIYYYAYNNLKQLNALTSANYTLLANNTQYLYPLTASNKLTFVSLANFYKIQLLLKYVSYNPINMTLSCTTPTTLQQQSTTLPVKTMASGVSYSSISIHSNNLVIQLNDSLYLVEIYLKLSQCSVGCVICLNKQLCELCSAPNFMLGYKCVSNCSVYFHFMKNMTCLTTCPVAYYDVVSSNSKFCQACSSPCLTCINATACLSCLNTFYYYNYTCITTCPSQYYQSNSVCLNCLTPCKTCTNQTNCLSCSQGYWNGVLCASTCPNGYFQDNTNNICGLCSSPCLTCRGTSIACLSCVATYILYNKQCLVTCPDRYYSSNGSCIQCQSPCYKCSALNICLSCSFNYFYNGSCISTCPTAFYIDLANQQCLPCMAQCSTCTSSSQCLTCMNGCLFEGRCYPSCQNNLYYENTVANNCVCTACNYPCNECLNETYCLSCIQGYYYEGNCITICPHGYYINYITNQCSTCHNIDSQCLECTAAACTLCTIPYYLAKGSCVTACPNQYYPVQALYCSTCQPPCSNCLSSTSCLSCISPYIYSVGYLCLIQCSNNQIPLPTFINNLTITACNNCTLPCSSCSVAVTNCTYCQFGYYLYNYACLLNCSNISPLFSYYNELSTSKCSTCSFPCKTCLTQSKCLSCHFGYFDANSNQCKQCSIGTFPQNGVCLNCPIQCYICFSTTFCTSCINGYFLFQNLCINNASICQINGYFVAGSVCQPCKQPCFTCTLFASNCLTCMTGYIYSSPHKCLVNCPVGYFALQSTNSTCLTCNSQCSSCISSASYCLSCNSPYVLYLNTLSCLSSCPSNTYLSGQTICSSCKYPCLACTSDSSCLSCISGVLTNTTCYSSCPTGYYANVNLQCLACTSPCFECSLSGSNCTQCMTSYSLFNNTCVNTCPSSYFAESNSQQCLGCVGFCSQCTNYVNCSSCKTNLWFYRNKNTLLGECVSTCPSQYYPTTLNSTLICSKCLVECFTCVDNTSCLLCLNGMVQYLGKCLSTCIGGMYASNGVCQLCTDPCLNCSDAYTCTACRNDSYLLVGSASCVPGPTCPSGYYLLVNSSKCDSKCPAGFYNLNNNTCNSKSCDMNEFMGEDMFCYASCPSSYLGNTTLHCVGCVDCSNGLFYQLKSAIIKDTLYLYVIFSQAPAYKVDAPTITITPAIPFDLITSISNSNQVTAASITASTTTTSTTATSTTATSTTAASTTDGSNNRVSSTSFTGNTNLTFQMNLNYSISNIYMTVKFESPLQTFSNPLQQSTQSIYIQGYDYYPQDLPDLSKLSYLALICSTIGLVKNPYMTDFGQLIFFIGLISYHYPYHLASFLEASAIAHAHQWITLIQQPDSSGQGKFLYVTNIGFLSNTIANLIIIVIGLLLALSLLICITIIKKTTTYRKIQHQKHNIFSPNDLHQNNEQLQANPMHEEQLQANQQQNQHDNKKAVTQEEANKSSLSVHNSCLNLSMKIQQLIFTTFKQSYLNILMYFNYSMLSLFSLTQLAYINFTSTINTISCVCAMICLLCLLIYAYSFKNTQPKYTFLYIKKLLISGAIILSLKDAIYAIGIISVCNLTTAILILTYKLEKYQLQTRFLASCEILQFLLQIALSFFIILGEGNHTTMKVTLCWVIIFFIVAILSLYIFWSISQLIIYCCFTWKDVNYQQNWIKNQKQSSQQQNHSQTISSSMKDHKEDAKNKDLSQHNLETYLIQIKEQHEQMEAEEMHVQNMIEVNSPKKKEKEKDEQELFWVYEHDEEDSQQQKQKNEKKEKEKEPPQMLVRVVNQFSDYEDSLKLQ